MLDKIFYALDDFFESHPRVLDVGEVISNAVTWCFKHPLHYAGLLFLAAITINMIGGTP